MPKRAERWALAVFVIGAGLMAMLMIAMIALLLWTVWFGFPPSAVMWWCDRVMASVGVAAVIMVFGGALTLVTLMPPAMPPTPIPPRPVPMPPFDADDPRLNAEEYRLARRHAQGLDDWREA